MESGIIPLRFKPKVPEGNIEIEGIGFFDPNTGKQITGKLSSLLN